jgi:hypothetical protein
MPQQFVVPQNIDSEPKLLGPITPRQFLIIFAAVLFCAFLKAVLSFALFIVASIPIAIITLVIAFVKINGQSFHYFVLNIIQTFKKPKVRVWKKDLSDEYLRQFTQKETVKEAEKFVRKEFIGTSRLNELSLIVNTGGAYRPESDDIL